MGVLALCAAVAVILGFVSLKVWRRWIEPWREVDELLDSITAGKPPRKFLMTGNTRARPIGLSLEKLSTRLREAERATEEGTLNLQTILSALPDGLVVVDERERIQLMNAEFRRLLALPETLRPGAAVLEVIRDATVARALADALADGKPRREAFQLAHSGAPAMRLEASISPFQHREKANERGAVIFFRDVTQVAQVEEMRRDFVANVSHELRTPLSIFRGYLETLLDDPRQPPAELIRILEIMERHSDRLTSLVNDVLSLARLEAPEAQLDLTAVDLNTYLPMTLRDWEKRFAAKQLRGELDLAAALPMLQADEGRLQEVVYNLLDNAVKYSPAGGCITVAAALVGDAIRLSVADHGPGIPVRDLPRIFERFYRADKARSRALGGTGLGLSIVKHIAQLHGGSVEAQSEWGRGTMITVTLPLRPATTTTLPDEIAPAVSSSTD